MGGNNMDDDDLVMQGAKTSATMFFTDLVFREYSG